MNNYRMSFTSYTDACDYADKLKRQGSSTQLVALVRSGDGWDVTWRMP